MPRPRFYKLDEQKKTEIISVSAGEFSEQGYDKASFNRIMERLNISKGAMYYYFDDKTDLYGTVLRTAFEALIEGFEHPDSADVEAFWASLAAEYTRFGAMAMAQPQVMGLMRGLLDHPERWSEGPVAELFSQMRSFTEMLVEHGQQLGAVRKDLDRELLVSVAFAVGEAVDRWSFEHIDQLVGEADPGLTDQLVGLFRRVLEPRGE